MSPITLDPVTAAMVQWAKRAALAEGRERMTVSDLLCGAHALREEPRVSGPLLGVLGVHPGGLAWPSAVIASQTRAEAEPETEERLGFDRFLDAAIAAAHAQRMSLAPEVLIPALLDQPDPVVIELRELNHGGAVPSALVGRLQGALAASEQLAAALNRKVLGQRSAVRMLADAYFRALVGGGGSGPRGVFTFLGPPGVGKTYLAESFAEHLGAGTDRPYAWKRFDMSTMAGEQNFEGLFGTEQIYKGSRPGTLTGFVAEHPRCVLLFDEIEKAHDLVIQSLLAVLDSGQVVDKSLDRPVDFHQSWLLFTTNLGREFFAEANASGVMQGAEMSSGAVFDLLASARRFRDTGGDRAPGDEAPPALAPEFVSRLAKGGAVVFRRLEVRHYSQLVERGLAAAVAPAKVTASADNHTSHSSDARSTTAPAALPAVTATSEARLVFLASLMPDLDARRAVSRSEAWALDLIKRSFEHCRSELAAANPPAWTLRIEPDAGVASWLDHARHDVQLRVLVVDEDDFLPARLTDASGGLPLEIRRVAARDAVAREVRRFRPTLVLLDLSLHEDPESPRTELGLSILAQLRREFPRLPVVLFSEDPQRREGFDRTLQAVMRHGGARGFVSVRSRCTDTLQDEDLRTRLARILTAQRDEAVLHGLRRGHKTLTFTHGFAWDPAATRITCALQEPRESVVYDAADRSSPIRFAGVPRETLSDVVGLRRAKRRLKQVIGWLHDPSRLGAFGVMPPRGFLLAGPPGTGKTLLARAVAGEAGLPFLSLSAGELKSRWVGESEARIREVFRKAQDYAPAIVFIDEIDGIARQRSSTDMAHTTSTLNQLLASMDGFTQGERSIFVLAATNHAESLDPAILRPGRFDEVIPIDRPDARAREELLRLRLSATGADGPDASGSGGLPTGALADLAAGTVGCTPAEIDRMVREAVYRASADGRAEVTAADLEAARRLVRFGATNEGMVVREDERRATAWHEAGHALVHAALLPDHGIDHLTIVPSEGGALGFLAPLVDETRHDLSRAQVRAQIAVALAGREAERLLGAGDLDTLGAGARSDLEHATALAWRAVTAWGFDPEFGPVALAALPDGQARAFCDRARPRVDAWLAEAAEQARETLGARRTELERLVDALLREEFLDGDGVREVLGSGSG
jgi:ATP-dependent metalloprotease FtsH